MESFIELYIGSVGNQQLHGVCMWVPLSVCTFLWPCSLWYDKKPLSIRWAGVFLCYAEIPAFDTCNEMTRQKVVLMREWPPFSSQKPTTVCQITVAHLLRFAEPITDRSLYTDEHDVVAFYVIVLHDNFEVRWKEGNDMPLCPGICKTQKSKLNVILVSSLTQAGFQMMWISEKQKMAKHRKTLPLSAYVLK